MWINRLFFVFLLLFFIRESVAAPSVSNISSSAFSHKDSGIVITGAGFGSKTQAAPFRYDNFESGTIGQRLATFGEGGWNTSSNTSVFPQYSTTQTRRIDTQSAVQQFTAYNTYNQYLGVWGSNIKDEQKTTAYISAWFWFSHGRAASSSPNQKLLNIGTEFDSGGYDAQNRVDVYRSSGGGSGHVYALNCSGSVQSQQYFEDTDEVDEALGADGSWHRYETYVDLGTLSGSNAYRDFYVDRSLLEYYENITELNVDHTECRYIDYILLGHYIRTETGDYGTRYWDEIYIDFTRQRVEICDSDTYGNSTHCEIQIPSAWSDTSITFTANQGTIDDGTAYLFVFDSENDTNPSGYEITFGESISSPSISGGVFSGVQFGGN
jgi:hypothetical protein